MCCLVQNNSNYVKGVDAEAVSTMDARETAMIKALWNDPGTQEAYDRRREFQLTDSAK